MSLPATARRLLKKHGVAVVMSYEVPGSKDPVSGQVITQPSRVTFSANAYPGSYTNEDVHGTNILASDIRLILEQISTTPVKGWRCMMKKTNKTYRVMQAKEITDAGTDIIYICQLRAE